MKRLIMLLIVFIGLCGCSKSEEQTNVQSSISEYEARIEEALLMDNGYQDAKFTIIREELDEFLSSSRDNYNFKISSPYEGILLDEAIGYYNKKNGTNITNLTQQDLVQAEKDMVQREIEKAEEKKEFEKLMAETEAFIDSLKDISKELSSLNVEVTDSQWSSTGNYLEIEGTIKNQGDKTIEFVQLRISLKNSDGDTIKVEETYAVGGEGLRVGESTEWNTMIRVNDYSKVDSFIVDISDYSKR